MALAVLSLLGLRAWADPSAAGPVGAAQGSLHLDPTKVVGADTCSTCHKAESANWQMTHHFMTFETMHKSEAGKAIAEKLGITSIKKNDTCVNCHYTMKDDGGTPKAISGISCESCHGAAADWLKIHNDYGPNATKETETPEHKQKRHADADAAGMIRKDRVNLIAANCFSCHTVPNETLVNTGGHKAGSDFELVSWSQGEVRHNYLADQTKNREESPERLRVLYVVGRATDLEYALRGTSKITAKGDFRDAMLARVRGANDKLAEILKAVPIAEYSDVLGAAAKKDDGSLKLSPSIASDLAEKLAAASAAFVAREDGKNLSAVDPLIPGKDQYKGQSQP